MRQPTDKKPKNVRNFYVQARTSGGTKVETGPTGVDGTLDIELMQRHDGVVTRSIRVHSFRLNPTQLSTVVYDGDQVIYQKNTNG